MTELHAGVAAPVATDGLEQALRPDLAAGLQVPRVVPGDPLPLPEQPPHLDLIEVAQLVEAGVDVLNTGGFIQKSADPQAAYATLKRVIKG